MFVFFRKVLKVVLSKIMKEQDDILCSRTANLFSLLWHLENKMGIHFFLLSTLHQ